MLCSSMLLTTERKDRCGKKGVDHHAGEQKRIVRKSASGAAGDEKDQKNSDQRSREGQQGNSQIKRARPDDDADNRAQRRTAGYAQDVGIGQRIAQNRLKHRPAQSERRAHDAREDNPRQTHGK